MTTEEGEKVTVLSDGETTLSFKKASIAVDQIQGSQPAQGCPLSVELPSLIHVRSCKLGGSCVEQCWKTLYEQCPELLALKALVGMSS